MISDQALVKKIVGRYGTTIDLERDPAIIIDIIRQFGPELGAAGGLDGGAPPGGAPPAPPPPPPPPPPGPTSLQPGDLTLRDLMKELLAVKREVTKLRKQVAG